VALAFWASPLPGRASTLECTSHLIYSEP
jgi:hypothetical protein